MLIRIAGESSVDASYCYNYFCCSSILLPSFPTGPWLCKDQAILLGKEQLTRLFLATGNLIPISDAEAETNAEVKLECEISPGPRAPQGNGQSFHPNSFFSRLPEQWS